MGGGIRLIPTYEEEAARQGSDGKEFKCRRAALRSVPVVDNRAVSTFHVVQTVVEEYVSSHRDSEGS